MKKAYIFFPLATVILALSVFGVNKLAKKLNQPPELPGEKIPVIMDNPELTNPEPEKEPSISQEPQKNEAPPAKFINTVPFTSQAPYAKWDNLHDEACEEASIIMAHYYLNDEVEIEMRDAEDEIQNMVKLQKTLFGSHKDLNAQEMIDFTKEYYVEEYELVHLTDPKPEKETVIKIADSEKENKTIKETSLENNEDQANTDEKSSELDKVNYHQKIRYLKEELAKGNIFIIPAAGRELENPYFQNPGPLYHALVLIGYDETKKEFITNDPGTRRGEGYRYSYEILWNAIHDFPGKKSEILKGNKTVILVKKEEK